MQKINFQDLPDTTTPVNASNMNTLQTNVENAINGVVESGSNTYGNWVKYEDGTMICTKNVTLSNVSFGYTQGALYFCPNQDLGSTPQTFTQVNSVIANVTSGNVMSFGAKNYSTTTFGSMQFVRGDNTTQTTITLDVVAIGKWK